MDRSFQRALFLFFLSLYTLTMSGRISSPDGEIVFRTTQSLVERGRWDVQPLKGWSGFGTPEGKDGKHYSLFGPCQSVVMVPFYVAGRWFCERWPHGFNFLERRPFPRDYYSKTAFSDAVRLFCIWLNVWVSALTCVVLYRLATRLGGSSTTSLVCALLYGLTTNAWAYSRYCFSEPLATLLMLLAFERLADYIHHQPHRSSLAWAGVFLGLSVLTHITIVLAVPFFIWYVWPGLKREERFDLPGVVALFLPLTLCAGLFFYYNLFRFGNPLETGRMGTYGHAVAPWVGLFGLLLSSGKGILWYSPIVWAPLFAAPSFLKRWPREGYVILGMAIVRVLFVASRSDWHGGFGVGPRFLVPLLPFLILLLLEVISRGERHSLSPRAERAFFTVAALSFFVQVTLVKCSVFDWLFWKREMLLQQGFSDSVIYNHLFLFSPSCSPLFGFLWFPPTDLLALDVFRYAGPPAFRLVLVVAAFFFAWTVVRLRSLLHSEN